jgi:hypothetical protein
MAVYVNFLVPGSKGVIGSVTYCPDRTTLSIPASTSRRTKDGELVVVHNAESGAVAVAWGVTSPDAAATTATTATTAGLTIPAGLATMPLEIPAGMLINVKAL